MRSVLVLALSSAIIFLESCTGAEQAKWKGFGTEFKVELLNCDGSVARTWTSTGKVLSEPTSDGYYFMDKESGDLIEISGTLVITSIND
ncbi:hypothetical protein AUTU_18360 [Aureibacter tunicatorum]|nr:hypothetical protein AUTU_18360 [Aureibacter tunicatorum]